MAKGVYVRCMILFEVFDIVIVTQQETYGKLILFKCAFFEDRDILCLQKFHLFEVVQGFSNHHRGHYMKPTQTMHHLSAKVPPNYHRCSIKFEFPHLKNGSQLMIPASTALFFGFLGKPQNLRHLPHPPGREHMDSSPMRLPRCRAASACSDNLATT